MEVGREPPSLLAATCGVGEKHEASCGAGLVNKTGHLRTGGDVSSWVLATTTDRLQQIFVLHSYRGPSRDGFIMGNSMREKHKNILKKHFVMVLVQF